MIEVIVLLGWFLIGYQSMRWESAVTKTDYTIGYFVGTFFGLVTFFCAVGSVDEHRQRYGLSWCDTTIKKVNKARKQYDKAKKRFIKKAHKTHTLSIAAIITAVDGNTVGFTRTHKPVFTGMRWVQNGWHAEGTTVAEAERYMINYLKENGIKINNKHVPWHSIISVEFVNDDFVATAKEIYKGAT